ncbi:MAG: glycosyltransferase [Verrucomicrobia bacterium]|nr:glycosyltransferase [Verrucomicrobiota bacterium]
MHPDFLRQASHWLSLIYHGAVSVFLLGIVLQTFANLRVFRAPRPRVFAPDADTPFVSVLVPARNEAHRIGPCVASLLAQDYPADRYELLVLDDHSQDGTAAVVQALGLTVTTDEINAATSPRRIVLSSASLPAGWTGKAWACHQLAQAARGDFFLFTDADTVHAPGTLGAAVGHALATDASLLSLWPRQQTETWSERLVIPLVYLLVLGLLPLALLDFFQRHPAVARRVPFGLRRALGAANGQFLLFRRKTYARIGGHAAVRAHLVEDVALGRLVSERTGGDFHGRLVNCDGSRLVACRMYRSFPELWEGFTKNLRAAFDHAHLAFWVSGVVQGTVLVLPFLFAGCPLLAGRWWPLALAQAACIYGLRALFAARFRTSWFGVLAHPFGQILALAIAFNSWRLSTRRGVSWKGRIYRLQPDV